MRPVPVFAKTVAGTLFVLLTAELAATVTGAASAAAAPITGGAAAASTTTTTANVPSTTDTAATASATTPANAATAAAPTDAAPNSTPPSAAPATAAPRYTFTWQLGQPDAPAPRGGTTHGPAVTLDNAPSKAWSALQEPGLSQLERDRRAILAMAGDYRVTFDFLEVESFPPQTPRDKPYQSWGTEKVYLDADSGKSISLVHILNMRIIQADGTISQPMVTKHWRQTWQYEPTEIVEYQGRDRWERRLLNAADSAGHWSQTVYQVDESPRYASLGRWSHSSSFSTWLSGDTWRPLPRREWSVRKDYQVLLGTNRHTITATGWVQEENNLKTVLTPEREIDPAHPYLAREYGVARYSRVRDADVAAADEYYQRTRAFWDGVLSTWTQLFAAHPQITLRAPVDQAGLFHKLFEYADQIAAGVRPTIPADEVIRQSLLDMGAPVPVQPRHSVATAAAP